MARESIGHITLKVGDALLIHETDSSDEREYHHHFYVVSIEDAEGWVPIIHTELGVAIA